MTAILLLVVLSACAREQGPPAASEFRIGAILHLTGDQAEPAQAFREGIELAVDELNRNGGIAGKRIVLIVEDDQLKPQNAHTAAVKLVEYDEVDAVVLASYLEGMAAGPYLEQERVPSIVLWDSAEDLEDIGEHVFGIGVWTPSAGESAAEFAYHRSGARKMAIVNVQNEWSQAVSSHFRARFEELGGEVTAQYEVAPTDTNDFRTIIAKIRSENPDGVYSPVTDGVTVFYRQLREGGFKGQIITSDIITESHIAVLGSHAEGIYQTQAADPANERAAHMVAQYRRKHGRDPPQMLFTAWGYDAVFLIRESAERANASREGITQGMYATSGFEGASGTISIDENGSSKTQEKVFEIRNGSFIPVN